MKGEFRDYIVFDEFARSMYRLNRKLDEIVYTESLDDWYKKCAEWHVNYILKGKNMNNVFQVLAIQTSTDPLQPTTILVGIKTVIAKNEATAIQDCLLNNAEQLKGKIGVEVLVRPFC